MINLECRELDPGYTSEVNFCDEQTWSQILATFGDANIYQTWPYANVTSGKTKVAHLILRRGIDIVAVAQARMAIVPAIKFGVAYVLWGPLWRSGDSQDLEESFRQAIRALRNEFVCKRGMVVRLFPVLFDDDPHILATIMAEEGFSSLDGDARSRTILMDLRPSIEELREGMGSMFKRNLKYAERKGLEVVEGSSDEMFGIFITLYREMVSRKKFIEPNDINQFRRIQAMLPGKLKMKILLCKSGEEVCSGIIYSVIANKAIYLFGATSNVGLKFCGSYLLHWKLIEELKLRGTRLYDLNGINPAKNPGTYKFKKDLAGINGRDVHFLGRFDSFGSPFVYMCVKAADTSRSIYRSFREIVRAKTLMRVAGKRRKSSPLLVGQSSSNNRSLSLNSE
jgi:hypothetical protein